MHKKYYNFDSELYNLLEECINENIPYIPKDILMRVIKYTIGLLMFIIIINIPLTLGG